MSKKVSKKKIETEVQHAEHTHPHYRGRRWSMMVPAFSFLLLIFAISLAVYLRYFAYTLDQQYGENSTVARDVTTSSGSSGSAVADSLASPEATLTSASDPLVVRTGSFVVTVDSASDTVQKITDIAKDLKGSVVSSTVSESANSCGSEIYSASDSRALIYPYYGCYDASITIRVPAESYAAARTAIEKVDENAKFDSESTQETDVTTQSSDLERLLSSYQTEETALEKLLSSATDVDDILKIRTQLSSAQLQIESLQQQIRDLDKNIQYSHLTVSISKLGSDEVVTTPSVSGRFSVAWAAMKQDLSNLGTGLIYMAVYAVLYLPFVLILLLLFKLVKRFVHRAYKKK